MGVITGNKDINAKNVGKLFLKTQIPYGVTQKKTYIYGLNLLN
jgi:hypothetical protein